jgi:hypothetical protein
MYLTDFEKQFTFNPPEDLCSITKAITFSICLFKTETKFWTWHSLSLHFICFNYTTLSSFYWWCSMLFYLFFSAQDMIFFCSITWKLSSFWIAEGLSFMCNDNNLGILWNLESFSFFFCFLTLFTIKIFSFYLKFLDQVLLYQQPYNVFFFSFFYGLIVLWTRKRNLYFSMDFFNPFSKLWKCNKNFLLLFFFCFLVNWLKWYKAPTQKNTLLLVHKR